MLQTGLTIVLMLGALVAVFGGAVALVITIQMAKVRQQGYFYLVIPVILITAGLTILLSGRSIDMNASLLTTGALTKHPLGIWVQRLGSIVMVLAATERIISNLIQKGPLFGAAPALTLSFVAFWAGSIGAPMFFSAHPSGFSHEYVYTLLLGLGALMLTSKESEQVLLTARNSLLVFLLAGYLVLPFNSNIVLDSNYSQGLISGLPRLAGLAPHAVTLGMLAQLTLLCLWARPFHNSRLNTLAWLLGMTTLLLAQSKTAWISFTICAAAMYLTLHGQDLYKKLTDPLHPQRGIALILVLTIATLIISIGVLFGDAGNKLNHFLNSESGAQLTSLTGRDIIWAAALDEWARNPIFGYGQSFLDQSYRISIGILNATHGHNQYMDLLARAGLVGAIPLTIYLIVLMAGSIRHAKASRGITLVIFLAIALRAVSEVPLTLTGYGTEFIAQLMLLILLPAYNSLSQAKQTRTKTATSSSRGIYTPAMHP